MLLLIIDYRLSSLENTNSLCFFLFPLINDESADNRYLKVSDKLVSAYFVVKNSKNISHIILGTVRQLMFIISLATKNIYNPIG